VQHFSTLADGCGGRYDTGRGGGGELCSCAGQQNEYFENKMRFITLKFLNY
jgi:hypothetical protein